MGHDVFISHSSEDRLVANAVCTIFESQGIRCWIAPRDVPAGERWAKAIVVAISNSKVMVLIVSNNANNSDPVINEITVAAEKKITILPFRIDECIPSDEMKFHIQSRHWLDALSEPREKEIKILARRAEEILKLDKTFVMARKIDKDYILGSQEEARHVGREMKILAEFMRPMYEIVARKLSKCIPEENKLIYKELTFMLQLFAELKWGNQKSLLQIKDCLISGKFISTDMKNDLLSNLEELYHSKQKPEIQSILLVLNNHNLTEDKVYDIFFDYPETELIPFLVLQYYTSSSFTLKCRLIEVLVHKLTFENRIVFLGIVEDHWRTNIYTPGCGGYKTVIDAARKILVEGDFNEWYKRISGRTYEEDIEKYESNFRNGLNSDICHS